jgi:hypothetical protein
MQTRNHSLSKDSPRAALEAIDHLTKKICLLWGTPELNLFIRHLMMDSRNGSRQGLPMEIAAEMVFLAETNTLVRAINAAKLLDIKFSEALKMIEAKDDQPLQLDVFDDPFVSRDTLARKEGRERFNPAGIAPVPRYPQRGTPAKNQTVGLLALFLMLVRGGWLWVIALVAIGYYFVWPWMQPLL